VDPVRGRPVSGPRDPSWSGEFDVVGVSVGAAVVSGALSVVAPSLGALTASLAALALAGWLALARRTPSPPRHFGSVRGVLALVSLGFGAGLFLARTGGLEPYRGLVLGLSLVPLWSVARRLAPGGS